MMRNWINLITESQTTPLVEAESEAKTFTPNAAMAKAAELGLRLRKEFKRGGTEVGVRRANQLSSRRPVSEADMKAIYSYFKRHAVDKQGKSGEWGSQTNPSNGYIAWLLWGGDAGQAWANANRPKLDEFQKTDVEKMITTGGDEPPMPPIDDDDGRGDGDRPEMVRVEGICWYTDDEEGDEVYSDDLPTEVTIPMFADPEAEGSLGMLMDVMNELDRRFGHKHNATAQFFEYRFV